MENENKGQEETGRDQPASASEEYLVSVVDNTGQVLHLKTLSKEGLAAITGVVESLPDAEKRATPIAARRPLPEIRSNHKTWLPGTQEFLTLTGSFGSSIARQSHLFSEVGFELITPAGVISVFGKDPAETEILQQYVEQELGPEGLKDLLALLEVYDHLTTRNRDQKYDVEVSLKQILQRMGLKNHANDYDAQMRLLHTARYLSSSKIVIHRRSQKRTTPLLIIESEEEIEGNVILKYHLGEDFFRALYGNETQRTRYALHAPQVMGYHSGKSRQELLFLFFLGNRLARGENSVYFPTLCLESRAYAPEDLQPGAKNRMRDAQAALYALERLERDGQICREPHPDIDAVLAVNAIQNEANQQLLAPATWERIETMLTPLSGYGKIHQNTKRRVALQRLLDLENSREEFVEELPEYCTRLTFRAGKHLLNNLSRPERIEAYPDLNPET